MTIIKYGSRVGVLTLLLLLPELAVAAERFEVAAWVDHGDFQRVFDTEKAAGLAKIIDHVAETGATSIWWRNGSGSTTRYQSKIESHHNDGQLDKRRVHMVDDVDGWLRYGEVEPDIIATMVKLCKERGLRPGIHWPYEETHFSGRTIGRFNLEHPQYWARTYLGHPWWGRSSIAFEPVVEHKLALLDELLDRGVESVFIEFWRSGGWDPRYEHVAPVVEDFRKKHGTDPPSKINDPDWARHVSGYVTNYLRRFRQHMKAKSPNVELAVGIPSIAPHANNHPMISRAADWRTWVDEGLVDTLVINYVKWDEKRPIQSTREMYREVLDYVDGRCRVLCPVQQYNYAHRGLPAYEKATGMSNADVAAALTRMAHEMGTGGISLECVDYNNYKPATRKTLRELTAGPCRNVRAKPADPK